MSKPTLTIDRTRLALVAKDLGLMLDCWPRVERLRDPRRPYVFVGGRYHGPDVIHAAHRLSVNPYQTPEAANRSLIHELTHALQCEQWGGWHRFDAEYNRQLAALGIRVTDADFYIRYREIPFEREAFAVQDEITVAILSVPE